MIKQKYSPQSSVFCHFLKWPFIVFSVWIQVTSSAHSEENSNCFPAYAHLWRVMYVINKVIKTISGMVQWRGYWDIVVWPSVWVLFLRWTGNWKRNQMKELSCRWQRHRFLCMCSRCLQYTCVVQGTMLSGTINVNGIIHIPYSQSSIHQMEKRQIYIIVMMMVTMVMMMIKTHIRASESGKTVSPPQKNLDLDKKRAFHVP